MGRNGSLSYLATGYNQSGTRDKCYSLKITVMVGIGESDLAFEADGTSANFEIDM